MVLVTIDNSFSLILKLHKNPYKQHYIAGSAKCTTKLLSKLLTSILTAVKEGLQSYHNTCYSHSGINSMWILLKNLKDLLETLNSRLLSECNSVKTYGFSTLYTSIHHTQLNIPTQKHNTSLFQKKMVHLDIII